MYDNLIDWIKAHAKKRGLEQLAFDFTNNDINEALVGLLCWKTRLPTVAVIYENQDHNHEPCTQLNIKPVEIYEKFDLGFKADIPAHFVDTLPEFNNNEIKNLKNNVINSILNSLSNSLIVGSIDENSYKIIRNYSKLEAADILPLASFNVIKVGELFKYASEELSSISKDAKRILNIFYDKRKKETNTIEINNLNITYEELIWLSGLDLKTLLISGEHDPAKYPSWFAFTIRQKEIIAKAYQIEKQTRYKYNANIPVFPL